MCECVVVYECMWCKEERRNQETNHIHTHLYTPRLILRSLLYSVTEVVAADLSLLFGRFEERR